MLFRILATIKIKNKSQSYNNIASLQMLLYNTSEALAMKLIGKHH